MLVIEVLWSVLHDLLLPLFIIQLTVNCWFGLVVWIPGIPIWKGLLPRGIPGIQTTNPNQQPTIPWIMEMEKNISWQMKPHFFGGAPSSVSFELYGEETHQLLLRDLCVCGFSWKKSTSLKYLKRKQQPSNQGFPNISNLSRNVSFELCAMTFRNFWERFEPLDPFGICK